MKKILTILAAAFLPSAAIAASGTQTVVNYNVAFSTSYVQNLQSFGTPVSPANRISNQVIFSSGNFTAQTFTGGRQSTGSVTVASNAIIATKATNSITVPSTALILGTPAAAQIAVLSTSSLSSAIIYINIGSRTEQFRQGYEWTTQNTASGTATSIASAINGAEGLVANRGGGTSAVVYTSASAVGYFGNSYTTALSAGASLSTTTFSGGKDRALLNATISFNGDVQRNGYIWTDASNNSTGTAKSIAAWLNNYGVIIATAPDGSSVVYATATTAGRAANSFTLSASTTAFTIGGATFSGGIDNGSVSINGKTYTAGVDFSTGAATSNTATSLASAINAASTTYKVIASAASNVVRTTSTVTGSAANYVMTSSTDAALTLSGPKTTSSGASTGAMTGGLDSAWVINTPTITLSSNGWPLALPVLYGQGSVAVGGLTDKTTYYFIPIDTNTGKLATSSANAVAGTGLTFTSSQTVTTSNSYTLTPIGFTQGSAAGKWQVSNDGTNWSDFTMTASNVPVYNNTFAVVFPSSNTVQDFGPVDFNYIRYTVTPPTWGAVNLKVLLNAKD